MDPSEEVSRSLIKWLQTLISDNCRSVSEISDGVAMLKILVQISSEHFSPLEPKIKTDVGSNWRLKVSNLKKIVESIVEYYQEVLNLHVLDVGKPDVHKIGETSNLIQLGKLLRLILGCAVNCERKHEYITQFMALEESVQQSIMQAIEQLEEVTGNTGRSGLSFLSLDSDTRIVHLMAELTVVNESKDVLAQKYHNLETQVVNLIEEKQALLSDYQLLASQVKERETLDSSRSPDNRRQMDLLKDELYKLETACDDYRAKTIDQDKQLVALQDKVSELQAAADTASRLKDEVDALSESADKVQILENTVASYKKRLDDFGDVKKQVDVLESRNVEYYQQILEYEEELKNCSMWKNQCEIYKKQAADVQQKLDEETQKADRATFQTKTIESRLSAVQGEKERLAQERNALKEEMEELKLNRIIRKGADGADVAQELTPTEMKERLRFLEKENRALRATEQDITSKRALLDDAASRIEKLTEEKRFINRKVLELEAQLQEQKPSKEDKSVQQLEINLKDYKQKVSALQEALANKESELQINQAKYSRNLERAREIAQNLDAKSNEGVVESLRNSKMKETEEQLLTIAFYRLSSTCLREAVDDRLAMLSAGQGQSFLSRQRQPTPRKPPVVQPFKSK